MKNAFEMELKSRKFDGKREARLGTQGNPAVISVQNESRKEEIIKIMEDNHWSYSIEVDSENPENIKDLDRLQNPVKTVKNPPKVGRNDPCPCGSGKKYKKCCG